MVLVALGQPGDVQRPDPGIDNQIQWDVCDLVISKFVAAQLEDGDFEVLHTRSHSGGDEPPYHIATSRPGHWDHSRGCEGCRENNYMLHTYIYTHVHA